MREALVCPASAYLHGSTPRSSLPLQSRQCEDAFAPAHEMLDNVAAYDSRSPDNCARGLLALLSAVHFSFHFARANLRSLIKRSRDFTVIAGSAQLLEEGSEHVLIDASAQACSDLGLSVFPVSSLPLARLPPPPVIEEIDHEILRKRYENDVVGQTPGAGASEPLEIAVSCLTRRSSPPAIPTANK